MDGQGKRKMTIDKIEMIYEDLQEVKKDVKELMELKNKAVGFIVALGALFGLVFDLIKNFFSGGRL